jgi:hypothetical protein
MTQMTLKPSEMMKAKADPEFQTRLDAERVTLEFATRSRRRLDAGKMPIEESPLFGGAAQWEMFPAGAQMDRTSPESDIEQARRQA